MQTVDRLGEDTGAGRLAHAARPAEEVGVGQLAAFDRVLQGRGNVLLPHDRRESGGAVFACADDKITHGGTKIVKAGRNRENLFSKISEALPIFCKDSESRVLRQIYLHFVGWNMRNEARCIVFENPFPVPAICSVIFAGDSLRCEYASRIKKDGSRNSRLSQCVAAGRLTLPSEPIRRAAH